MDVQRFDLSRPMPLALRLFLGAAGLVCVALPAWEFRQAFMQPGIYSLFFAAIILGGWIVGGAFIFGALFGEQQAWRFSGGGLHIARRSVFIAKTDTIHGRDVESIEVREIEWDSRPHTFAVVIRTKLGASYESRDVATRDEAAALAAHVRARFGPTR